MHTASDALKAWLPTARQIYRANLYTFTLLTGEVFRWTDAGRDLVSGGNTFSSSGPQWQRDTVAIAAGTEVSSITLTVADGGTSIGIGSLTVLQSIAQGAFDGADVRIEAAFMASFGDTATMGTIILFAGRLATISNCNRSSAQMEIRSYLEYFDTQLPRNLYQPGCLHTLYDAGCTLSRSSFQATGAVAEGSTSVTILASAALGQSDGYYALGILTFTSGANSGLSYAVKAYTAAGNGTLTLDRPTLQPVVAGDAFTVSAGCDKTLATCTARFANAANFAGQPFVPAAEAAL